MACNVAPSDVVLWIEFGSRNVETPEPPVAPLRIVTVERSGEACKKLSFDGADIADCAQSRKKFAAYTRDVKKLGGAIITACVAIMHDEKLIAQTHRLDRELFRFISEVSDSVEITSYIVSDEDPPDNSEVARST